MNQPYDDVALQNLDKTMHPIPLFPLPLVLFPGGKLPLRIFEPRYPDLVRRSLGRDAGFGIVMLEGPDLN